MAVAVRQARDRSAPRPPEAAPTKPSQPVEVRLLHGFEVRAGGGRVDLPPTAQRLLAFLALQRRPLQRTYVAGALWTGATETRSLASLRSALWKLRRPPFALVTSRGTVLQLPSDLDVDVEALVRLARRALEDGKACGEVEIESLLDGDLLPDWYDDWVLIERERLRHLRLHALESLCDQLTAVGRYPSAIEAGFAAVRAEPLRESAHRALIRAHLAEGNTSEALRLYRSFCGLLRRELGLRPSPLLQAIVARLPR
jgi:DNA-binding SARP family transcriptional activator